MSACTVQRSIIDLSGICSLRLKAAPQIHNFIPSKTTVTRYRKCNVVGMAEQISKKAQTPGDHVVEMLQTWVP